MYVSNLMYFCISVANLPRPMEGMGRLQFSDLFTELPVPPQAAGVIGPFNVLFIYHSDHYGLILDLTDAILFLQCLLFFNFCAHFHFFASTLCMCVMYLMSFDGFF